MVSKYRVRRIFRPLVGWIAKQFAKTNITPNQVSFLGTIIALIGCLFFIFLLSYWGSFLFAIFIFTAGLLDGVDGALARLTDQVSIRGGYLDSVLDRYTDAFIILSFLARYPPSTTILAMPLLFWILFTLIGVLMVSYIRSKAEFCGVPNCDVGLAGRSERLLLFVIFALLNCIQYNFSFIGLVVVGILANLTAIYRIYFVYNFKTTE
jgi:CDP-diacylglycerol--glycerol-3-phosphate 3-phosphatidyltransferase